MKELKIVALVVGFLAAIVFAASAHAQELTPRVVVDLGVAGGQLKNIISWPYDQDFKRSDDSDTRGVDFDATVRLTKAVNFGFRFNRDGLHNATIRERREFHYTNSKKAQEQEWVNPGENTGTRQYYEVYGELAIKGSRGHSIIGGYAWDSIEENNRYVDTYGGVYESGHKNGYSGVIVGGKGKQNFREVAVDYSVRLDFYPLGQNSVNGDLKSHVFETSEMAIWNFSSHVGIGGGHVFLTHRTESTAFNQDQGGHRFLLKTRLSF